jgi:MFS family permease
MTSPTTQRFFGGRSRNTLLLALSNLFADMPTEMLYPVLPVFLTQVLHATGSIVGLIVGFAQATQNVAHGFSGALSDKLQKRRSIALCGSHAEATWTDQAHAEQPAQPTGRRPSNVLQISFFTYKDIYYQIDITIL